MKTHFYNAASWVNADPSRAKALSVLALLAMFAAAHFVPGAQAVAGPIGGSGDIGGL